MSSFCTSCGASYRGNSFCTSCGAVQRVVESNSAEPTSVATPNVLDISDAQLMPDGVAHEPQISDGTRTKSKRNLIFVAVAVVFFCGSTLGAFIVGKSSVDLKNEKKISYDSGFNAGDAAGYSRGDAAGYSRGDAAGYSRGDSDGYSRGDSDGYSRGDSAGYSRGYDAGKTAGCEGVFSFSDGVWDYLVPWSPYYSRKQGRYYTSRSDC